MTGRRDFFRTFLGHVQIAAKEVQGYRHMKLSDLDKLSQAQFGLLKVRIKEGLHIRVDQKQGHVRVKDEEWVHVFDRDTREEMLFRYIQQRFTMDEMIACLQTEYELDTCKSYTVVRTFVLNLVNQGVCIPANHVHYQETKIVNDNDNELGKS